MIDNGYLVHVLRDRKLSCLDLPNMCCSLGQRTVAILHNDRLDTIDFTIHLPIDLSLLGRW